VVYAFLIHVEPRTYDLWITRPTLNQSTDVATTPN